HLQIQPATEYSTLSLHDALPISLGQHRYDLRERVEVGRINDFARGMGIAKRPAEWDIHRAVAREDRAVVAASGHAELRGDVVFRSEEHTSELQSQSNLVCRLLLE